MKLALALTMVLLVPASAGAQESPLTTASRVAFTAGAVADWTSTYAMLKSGNHELNPTLRIAHDRPAATVALGAAIDVVGVVAWQRFVGRRHPKLAASGLFVASAFRFYLASHNKGLIDERSNKRGWW